MVLDNINIQGNKKTFVYMLGYDNTLSDQVLSNIKYEFDKNTNTIYLISDDTKYKKINNLYVPRVSSENENVIDTELVSEDLKFSHVNIYFPRFSLDTYKENTYYALTLYTWVNGYKIDLGTSIFNRINAIANPIQSLLAEDDYYEYISIPIIDPYSIIYSDNWKNFRIKLCKEPNNNDIQLNNTGSLLYCALQPIEYSKNNSYILSNDYIGGQNSLNIANIEENDYLNVKIIDNINNDVKLTEEESKQYKNDIFIKIELDFNKEYNNNIKQYLQETYCIDDVYVYFELMLRDNNNVYNKPIYTDTISLNDNEYFTSYIFNKEKLASIFGKFDDENKMTMESYIPGLKLTGAFTILSKNQKAPANYDNKLLYIISNDIILSKDKFNYLLNNYENEINSINLDTLNDMKIVHIDAINKIENKIIQMDKPENSKANIIMPVFFKVNDLANIVIHPEVNENISINLDVYKSKVRSFIIQIEGVQFSEIGRTDKGVIFKIIGKQLPRSSTSGIYYILSQDQDMIVSGKYTYEL